MSAVEGDKSSSAIASAGTGGSGKVTVATTASGSAVTGGTNSSGTGAVGSGAIGGTTTSVCAATATTFPIDLASASKVLVRPTEKTNMQTTYRIGTSGGGSQMRVVIPGNAAPQTLFRQAINIKQDTTPNRTQITALPARTVNQSSITVSRSQTPTTYHVPARVPATVANIQAPRATITAPIRIPTPPINVANINTYVRQSVPSRTSSPSAAIIAQAAVMPNFQMQVPSQLIRANSINQGPRARVVTQTIPANQTGTAVNNAATITANVVTHQATTQANPQAVSISGTNPPQQAFVATLSTVLQPPRQISTLVYTNNSTQQPYTAGTNQQRLTLATTLSSQRPTGVRPIHRLPSGGIRVNAGSISIRPPSVPVLTPTTVLTTIASGNSAVATANRNSAVSTANISNTIPARIIQVQNSQSGNATQLGRIQTNLLNIQPVLLSNNRVPPSTIQAGLTISQVNKLTSVAAAGGVACTSNQSNQESSVSAGTGTATLQTASGQQIVVSAGSQLSSNSAPSTATIITGNLITNQSGVPGPAGSQGQLTQIVNVNPVSVGSSALGNSAQQIVTVSQGQVIGTQQAISVSATGGNAAGSATVIPIPLQLTSARNASIPVSVATLTSGQNPINIVSGGSTITGFVRTTTTAGAAGIPTSTIPAILPVAKVTPQQISSISAVDNVSSSAHYSVTGAAPSLYIQTRSQPNTIITTVGGGSSVKGGNTLNIVSTGANTATGTGTTFLPTSTFYYERVTSSPATGSLTPSSSTQVPHTSSVPLVQSASTLSSTTITTTSAISGPVFSISSSVINNAGISTASGAVVSGVSSSQVSTSSSVPYSPSAGSFAIVQTTGRSLSGPIHGIVPAVGGGAQNQPNQQQSQQQQQQQTQQQQNAHQQATQIVPVRFHPQLLVDGGQTQQIIMTGNVQSAASATQQQTHMLIPVNTGKLESPQASILRKRGIEGPRIKAYRDLTSQMIELEDVKILRQFERERERDSPPHPARPPSSDGSTTVSATSSPGVEQQEQEEIKALAYATRNSNTDLPFKPVHEDIFHHSQDFGGPVVSQEPLNVGGFHHPIPHQAVTMNSSSSNGNYEQSPRKKARKQQHCVVEELKPAVNNLQFIVNREVEISYRMDTNTSSTAASGTATVNNSLTQHMKHMKHNNNNNSNTLNSNNISNNLKMDHTVVSGATNVSLPLPPPPKEIVNVKKPTNASLLHSYKQTWKAASNHFQRYTDVKQREERRATVTDIANQSHILQKVNGWKIYHLSAQIEDLCELESQAYDKLGLMLRAMESTPKPSTEIERINELLKGNMQRSKIIIDGITEARTQIMKIFDHKTRVSDIIQRCASKRNFKKREKT